MSVSSKVCLEIINSNAVDETKRTTPIKHRRKPRNLLGKLIIPTNLSLKAAKVTVALKHLHVTKLVTNNKLWRKNFVSGVVDTLSYIAHYVPHFCRTLCKPVFCGVFF